MKSKTDHQSRLHCLRSYRLIMTAAYIGAASISCSRTAGLIKSSHENGSSPNPPTSIVPTVSDDTIAGKIATNKEFPASFKALGLFSGPGVSRPLSSFIEYGVKVQLWSDGLNKQRFIYIPTGSSIAIDTSDNKLVFPIGTIIVKHFSDDSNPIETRLLVHDSDGAWKMSTYQWGPDGDATRVDKPAIAKSPSSKSYRLPSPDECKLCHSPGNAVVLGFQPDQLNGAPAGAHTTPMQDLANIQGVSARLFAPGVTEAITAAPTRPDPSDTKLSTSLRARAYMDLNCSTCHNPKGSETFLDYSLATGLTTDYPPTLLDFQRVIPGDPEHSVIWQKYTDPLYRMPPLSLVQDPLALSLLRDWINAWPATANSKGTVTTGVNGVGTTNGAGTSSTTNIGTAHGSGTNTGNGSGTNTGNGSGTNTGNGGGTAIN